MRCISYGGLVYHNTIKDVKFQQHGPLTREGFRESSSLPECVVSLDTHELPSDPRGLFKTLLDTGRLSQL